MATHSSVLAWRIPGTGESGGLLSMGSHRVGHDWSDLAAAAYKGFASLYFHQYCIYPISVLSCVCRCCMLSIFYIFANLLGKIVYICISSYKTIFLQCIVWLSWFKGTLYICLCELHAHILCPSIRLLLFF